MSPLKAVPQHPRRWRSFEEWVGSRNSAFALFGLALAVFALESVFLPAYPGRDMSRYLETFFQLGYDVPVYPAVLNTRGPLSAIGVGVPLDISVVGKSKPRPDPPQQRGRFMANRPSHK